MRTIKSVSSRLQFGGGSELLTARPEPSLPLRRSSAIMGNDSIQNTDPDSSRASADRQRLSCVVRRTPSRGLPCRLSRPSATIQWITTQHSVPSACAISVGCCTYSLRISMPSLFPNPEQSPSCSHELEYAGQRTVLFHDKEPF